MKRRAPTRLRGPEMRSSADWFFGALLLGALLALAWGIGALVKS